MARNAGYFAQRSTQPNKVLNFVKEIPENVFNTNELTPELKKRLKVRTPKISKNLIDMGVDDRVVSGYFAGAAKFHAKERAFFYHVTTFPNSAIVEQQSHSIHFTSCMRKGFNNGGKDDEDDTGAYYFQYIANDIQQYEDGLLGMLVVGNPFETVEDHVGDGKGFKARAKVRVMYEDLKPRALLIDRIYEDASLLLSQALPALVAWNESHYNLPILLAYAGRVNDYLADFVSLVKDVSLHDLFPPNTRLTQPTFGGYQDVLIHEQPGLRLDNERRVYLVDTELVKQGLTIKSLQCVTYKRVKDTGCKTILYNSYVSLDAFIVRFNWSSSKQKEPTRLEKMRSATQTRNWWRLYLINKTISKTQGHLLPWLLSHVKSNVSDRVRVKRDASATLMLSPHRGQSHVIMVVSSSERLFDLILGTAVNQQSDGSVCVELWFSVRNYVHQQYETIAQCKITTGNKTKTPDEEIHIKFPTKEYQRWRSDIFEWSWLKSLASAYLRKFAVLVKE